MSIKQDGLSQLLSSYGFDESEDSSSDKEDSDEKGKQTIRSVKKGNSHEACDGCDPRCEDCMQEMLPLPSGVLDMFKEDSIPEDEPSKHDGRVRTFSHFPGNWAMHVFIPFKASVHFESLVVSVVECLSAVTSHEVHMIPCDELHMSVSRTVPIRHYWIEPIVQQLRNGLSTVHSFVSALQWPELYTNDEKTRSFVALKIMSEYKKFKDIVDLINEVFQEFSLPAFYKDPSFHVSVAWLLGDICSERTQDKQFKLQEVFDAHICEKDVARSLVLEVTEVHCKIGNKHFVFPLDAT
ncbi:hypothetical protein ACROYT_G013985 [Oculina patagonica]